MTSSKSGHVNVLRIIRWGVESSDGLWIRSAQRLNISGIIFEVVGGEIEQEDPKNLPLGTPTSAMTKKIPP